MITKSRRKPLGERLKVGLSEAVQFAKGEVDFTNRAGSYPAARDSRQGSDCFADSNRYVAGGVCSCAECFGTETVQSWEQGVRKPSHAALRMLQLFRENPTFVFAIVGIPARPGPHQEPDQEIHPFTVNFGSSGTHLVVFGRRWMADSVREFCTFVHFR